MSLRSALALSRPTRGGFAVIGLCWGAIAALIPQLKAQIGASDALYGVLLLASAVGLVSAMWLAPLADRLLGRAGLPVAAAGMALVFPAVGLVQTPLQYAAVMVCLGAVSGMTDIIANARVSDLEAQHRSGLMNFNHGVFSIAYAVSAVGAGLGREAGLPPAAILCVPALACLALVPFMGMAPAAPEPRPGGGPAPRLPLVLVGLAGGIVLVAFMTEAALEVWSALHVERTLGGRAAEGALGPAMLGLTMAVGRMGGHLVAERLRDTIVLRWAAVLAAAGIFLAAVAPAPAVAYLGFGLAGLGISVIGPLGIALAGRLVEPGLRTRAIARVAVIGFCGFFFASPLMGLLAETGGLRLAFAAVAAFVLLTLPLVALLGRASAGQRGEVAA